MQLHFAFLFIILGVSVVLAAEVENTSIVVLSRTDSVTSDITEFTGSYLSYTTTTTSASTATNTGTNKEKTTGTTTYATESQSMILLSGTKTLPTTSVNSSMTLNSTGTSTSPGALPTNTQACNDYPEFCERSYSNITMVTAHNSPFIRSNSLSANQLLPVTDQLNDGIRMVEFETHWVNDTMYLCHTSCDLLNVGTLEAYLTTVTGWLKNNPYDVVTILMVNSDFVGVGNYTAPIENSGLMDLAYVPPQVPMGRHDWPTLSSMILSGKRAVVFMDYDANQTTVPYILDEFSQMWETPFSPTNRSFPCTEQRPPGLSAASAETMMYMANHNLNLQVDLLGYNILIPDTAVINETNAVSGFGSLGAMATECRAMWNRAPNFLLVDYYNEGSFPGSVFEVAAQMNGVNYTRKCCGQTSAAPTLMAGSDTMRIVTMTTLASLIIAGL